MPIAYAVLFLSAAVAAYILIGYPLLLAMHRGPGRPVAKNLSFSSAVSAIIAVHNGADFVGPKLDSILALDYPRDLLQIIVVSDGSTDATESIVQGFADRGVQLLVVPRGGKASALNAAMGIASGDILFFTDVRQALDPGALRHLVANFADPAIGAVTGEMRLLQGRTGEQMDMDLYWRYEVWARKVHSNIDSIFAVTGCIYALRRSLATRIPPDTLSDDAMLPLNAFFQGYRVVFDPAAIAIDYPTKSGAEFRRRRRTLAGLCQVFARKPELFGARDRMRWHFLSHKFGRLVLPWALILNVAATFALPPTPFRQSLIWGDFAFLVLALVDLIVPHGFPLKRLTSPARTFLLMNLASIGALAVFFTKPGKFWAVTKVEKTQPKPAP